MRQHSVLVQKAFQAGHTAVVAILCAVMIAPPALSGEAKPAERPSPGSVLPAGTHRRALTQQQKVLQALNRLTFGPRPGDEAAVRRMGLEAWFQMQLHPERIDDSAFQTQMQAFPAMQLSQAELMWRFPSPQLIRQMSRRDAALPGDPVERAIYADAEAAYNARLKMQGAALPAAVQAAAPQPGQAMQDEDGSPQASRFHAGPIQSGSSQAAQAATSGNTLAMAASGSDEALAKTENRRKMPVKPMDASDAEAILALPSGERFHKLLAMPAQESVSFREALRPYEKLNLVQGFSPQQVEVVEAMQAPVRVIGAEAIEARLLRDISSQRQLQAVMTDFWLNHFNVYLRKNQKEPYFLPAYERDAILPNALGRFEDLLVATAKSPAMLMYLDNWQSIGPDSPAARRVQMQQANSDEKQVQKKPEGINENYARELMELHTLGVGGGYTQKDVIEVAKCFTGWTIQMRPGGPPMRGTQFASRPDPGRFRPEEGAGDNPLPVTQGEFVFNENRHEPGSKIVLGHTIPEGGMNEGLEVLHILATSPATARFISQELAVRFVSDTPPSTLVDSMTATFLKTDGGPQGRADDNVPLAGVLVAPGLPGEDQDSH